MTPSVTGWYIGFIIAFAIILGIVVAVAAIIQLARTIGLQAGQVAGLLDECRRNTADMPQVQAINDNTGRINEGLAQVRSVLSGWSRP